MKIKEINPPRRFEVGLGKKIVLKDCAHISLDADEQVTFCTETGAEYDVARKSWGFYATPSLNGRLANFGLRGVLVKNPKGQVYLLLVERGSEEAFYEYLDVESQEIICWLDSNEAIQQLFNLHAT